MGPTELSPTKNVYQTAGHWLARVMSLRSFWDSFKPAIFKSRQRVSPHVTSTNLQGRDWCFGPACYADHTLTEMVLVRNGKRLRPRRGEGSASLGSDLFQFDLGNITSRTKIISTEMKCSEDLFNLREVSLCLSPSSADFLGFSIFMDSSFCETLKIFEDWTNVFKAFHLWQVSLIE